MEYASNGTVNDKLTKRLLSPTEKAIIALGISYGLKELHRRGILHLDLKPANVLLNQKNQPLLCDFGLSFKPAQLREMVQKGQILGSYPYVSPEILESEEESKISSKVDIFSLGIILYNLLTERQIFSSKMRLEVDKRTLEFYYKNDIRPDLEEYRSTNIGIVEIIERCWSRNPSERPTIEDIIFHLSNIKNTFEFTDENKLKEYITEIERREKENENNPISEEEMSNRIEELEKATLEYQQKEINEHEKTRSFVHLSFSRSNKRSPQKQDQNQNENKNTKEEEDCNDEDDEDDSEFIERNIQKFFENKKLSSEELEEAKFFFERNRHRLNERTSFLIADEFYKRGSDICFEFYDIAIEEGSEEAGARIQRLLKMKNVHITFERFVRYAIQNAESLNDDNIYTIDYEEGLNSLLIAKNYIDVDLVHFIKKKLERKQKTKTATRKELEEASSSIDSFTYSNDTQNEENDHSSFLSEKRESEEEISTRYDEKIAELVSQEYQKSRFEFHRRKDNEISTEGYERRARNGCPTSAAFLARPLCLQIRRRCRPGDSKLKKQYLNSIELCVVNGNKDYITSMIDILKENKHNKNDIKRSERLKFMQELINNEKAICKSPLFTYEEMIFDKNEDDNKIKNKIKNQSQSQIEKNKKQITKTSNEDYSYYSYSDDYD